MTDDIEHLKTHKIERRVALPQYGSSPPPADVEEAFGGTGEAPIVPIDRATIERSVVAVLKDVYDPEIPINIYDLGLIYGVDVDRDGGVEIRMTLTAPACPVAGALVEEVAQRTGEVEGVRRSHVRLVWDPPWTKERMTEEAMLELGLL